jgi:hypothetical protein
MILSETGLRAAFYTLQEGYTLLFLRCGYPLPRHRSYDASRTLAATFPTAAACRKLQLAAAPRNALLQPSSPKVDL